MVDRRSFLKQAGSFACAGRAIPVDAQKPTRQDRPAAVHGQRDMNRIRSRRSIAWRRWGTRKSRPTASIRGADLLSACRPRSSRKRLQDRNLPTPSGHYDLQQFLNGSADDLNRYVDRCAEGARILGQRYIVWPYLEPKLRTVDTYKRVAGLLNTIGTRLAKSGLQVAYHNDGGEFIAQNGELPYDIILRETDPALVKMQIDLYWHAHDTSDPPHALFTRAKGRFVMWHVKDLHKVSRDYTELGNGTIDYTRIWPDTALSGMRHFFVEQGGNFAVNAMQSAADGMAYVKKYLQQ